MYCQTQNKTIKCKKKKYTDTYSTITTNLVMFEEICLELLS